MKGNLLPTLIITVIKFSYKSPLIDNIVRLLSLISRGATARLVVKMYSLSVYIDKFAYASAARAVDN